MTEYLLTIFKMKQLILKKTTFIANLQNATENMRKEKRLNNIYIKFSTNGNTLK